MLVDLLSKNRELIDIYLHKNTIGDENKRRIEVGIKSNESLLSELRVRGEAQKESNTPASSLSLSDARVSGFGSKKSSSSFTSLFKQKTLQK